MENQKEKTLQEKLNSALIDMDMPILNQVNPFHKNKYADLLSVLTAVKTAFRKNGLGLMQIPTIQDSKVELKTIITDGSAQIEYVSNYPVQKTDAQSIGGYLTYFKRYTLISIFGLFADPDMDAEDVQNHEKKLDNKPEEKNNNHVQKTETKHQETQKIDKNTEELKAIKMNIFNALQEIGISEADMKKEIVKYKLELKIQKQLEKLTIKELQKIYDKILDKVQLVHEAAQNIEGV